MTLVRCPIHKIPYNDENPRGCPACAREREGGGQDSSVMKELARASQTKRPSVATPAPMEFDMPVTSPPRAPTPGVPRFTRALHFIKDRQNLSIAGAVILLLIIVLFI